MDNVTEWTSLLMPELLIMASRRIAGREAVLDCPSCPPDDRIGRGSELNWLDVGGSAELKRGGGDLKQQKVRLSN